MSLFDINTLNILQYVARSPHSSQRRMAKDLGVSLGAVNFCVQALIEKGWVKVHNFKESEHKWRYAYVLTPRGVKNKIALTRRFLEVKYAEYERIAGEIEALERALAEKG